MFIIQLAFILFIAWAIGSAVTAGCNLFFAKKIIDYSAQHKTIAHSVLLRLHNGISICQCTTDVSRSLLSIQWSKTDGWKTSFFWKKNQKDGYEQGKVFFWQECQSLGGNNVRFTTGLW